MESAINRLKGAAVAMTGWRRYALAAVLGVLATAALPPFNIVVLLIPAFAGLAWMIEGASRPRAAFALGWWFGFGHFVSGVYWTSISMLVDPESYAWMIPFAVFGLPAVLAVFPALAVLLTRMSGAAGVGRILVLGAAWMALEWVRSWLFTGLPWNLIATAWTSSDSMMQFAAYGGSYGLGLLSVIVAAMPAVLAGGDLRRKLVPVVAAFAVLGVVWGAGLMRLASADDGMVDGVRLRLVQPNIGQKLKWKRELLKGHISKQLRISKTEAELAPTHVIWAETAVPYPMANAPEMLEQLSTAAPPDGVLITGAPRMTPLGEKPFRVWNSLHAVDSSGKVVGTYDKFHLVPFGEYVPFQGILKIAKITAGRGSFTPGTGLKTMKLPGLPPFSPLICYEVIFPGQVADREQRPNWLLNITNDAWYGRSSGPYQHLAAARMRAVEEGLPLVRVAFTGISAVIDAYGRTRASLGLGIEGFVDSGLPVHLEEPTPYARFGDWIALAMFIMALAGGFLAPGGLLRRPSHKNE